MTRPPRSPPRTPAEALHMPRPPASAVQSSPPAASSRDVASVLGGKCRTGHPVRLEQLFAFVNWLGYIGVTWGAAGNRHQLAGQVRRPARSCPASPTRSRSAPPPPAPRFGPIDASFSQRTSPARWTWQPAGSPEPAITFTCPPSSARTPSPSSTTCRVTSMLVVRQPPGNG